MSSFKTDAVNKTLREYRCVQALGKGEVAKRCTIRSQNKTRRIHKKSYLEKQRLKTQMIDSMHSLQFDDESDW